MPAKRKRSTGLTLYNNPKRSKLADTADDEEPKEIADELGDSKLYPIKRILDEREGEYKINWKGTNPKTRKPWRPTWEPKGNATQAAIDDWEHRRRERERGCIKPSLNSTRVPSTPPRSSISRDTLHSGRPQTPSTPLPPIPRARPARPRYIIPSDSPAVPSSSLRSEKQGGNHPGVQDSPVTQSNQSPEFEIPQLGTQEKQGGNHPEVQDNPITQSIQSPEFEIPQLGNHPEVQDNPVAQSDQSPEFEIPQLGTQKKQGYTIHQASSNSYPTQPSCGHEDSGIGSLSPKNNPLHGAQAAATVVSAIPSESLGKRDFNHEHHTTTTGSTEPGTLFIADSRPSHNPNFASDFEENFDAAVIPVQRPPLPLPRPEPEVDLDDLELVSPSGQIPDDRRTSHLGPGFVSLNGIAEHISQNQSSSEAIRTFEISHFPLGQFSQEFSTPEQSLSTQLQPGLDNSLLGDAAESGPSQDPSPARNLALTARDNSSSTPAATTSDNSSWTPALTTRDGSSVTPTPTTRDSSSVTPTPTNQQVNDRVRSSPEEGIAPWPTTPSAQIMDSSNTNVRATPSSSQSLRDRIHALREEMDNPVTARADPSGSATPSGPPTAIPDKPIEQLSSEGPNPLSQRVVPTSPPTFVRPMDLGFDDTDMIMMQSSPSKSLKFGPDQYVIPIPIEAIAKDEYLRQIGTSAPLFRSILGVSPDDSQVSVTITDEMERANTAIQSLHRIIAHTDLNIEGTATQRLVTATTVADWSGLTSQKFYFLRLFLECSKDIEKRVCIVAQEGRLLDILETFLKGRNIAHSTLRKPKFSPTMGDPLIVDLLSMSDFVLTGALSKPDLIIAFDTSFDAEHAGVKRLRGDIPENNNQRLVPIVHLLAPFSVEHIERCLPPRLQGLARQQALVKATLKYSTVIAGMRNNDDDPDSGYPVDEYALYLMSFLQSNVWPDPRLEMPPLDLDFGSEGSSPIRELGRPTVSGVESRSMTPGGHKRSLSRNFETPMISTSKRQRLTPLGDVTDVSDSVHGSQLEQTLRETQQMFKDSKIENAKQIRDLQAALARSESAIHDHLKQISELRDNISTTTFRLQEQVSAHGQLQHRYESRTNEVHKLRLERDNLVEKITGLETKRDNVIKENTRLKEERVHLQSDLVSARNDLKSAGGITGDMEVLREENRKLANEKASAEKRNVSAQSDLSFTRQLYQEVSTKVASTANENGRLELENGDLKKKADNAAAHLKNLSLQKETDSYLHRTEELEATLASRDELLRRKEEELRELRKGRGMGTRASSVQPRSPRLGTSRPASPAPGNLVPMQMPMARGASALRYPQEFR